MKHARQDYNRIQDPTGKIPDNEPVFLLRGQDVCAPFAVQAWADEAEKRGADPELVRKARAWAAEMLTYQSDKKSKVPDGPQYHAPDIIPGLGFRIVNSNGFYYIQATDTSGTCLVYAYDNAGAYLWRDRWVANEMRKFFEKGDYWAVRLGELNEGRRLVLHDPGPITEPTHLGMDFNNPEGTGPQKFPDNSDAFRKWVDENKAYPFKRMEHETWVWLPAGVTRENFLIEWESYKAAYGPRNAEGGKEPTLGEIAG